MATSLATAAAMLHSTLPARDADTFKMLGWAYTRAATAGVTATEAADEDTVGAAAALHVEEEALLGYSQVRRFGALHPLQEGQLPDEGSWTAAEHTIAPTRPCSSEGSPK